MVQNGTKNRGSIPSIKKLGSACKSSTPDLKNQRALEDSNPRPFGP